MVFHIVFAPSQQKIMNMRFHIHTFHMVPPWLSQPQLLKHNPDPAYCKKYLVVAFRMLPNTIKNGHLRRFSRGSF